MVGGAVLRLTLDGPDGHPIHRVECDCGGKFARCPRNACDGSGLVVPRGCDCEPCLRESRALYGADRSAP